MNVCNERLRFPGGPFLRAACAIGVMCGASCSPGRDASGYWSVSCLSGDGRYLLAGGDHAALVDLSTGKIVERAPGMVKAVGCDEGGGVVVGYVSAVRLPGKAPVTPVPPLSSDAVLARGPEGAWISGGRRSSAGKWRGPASVVVLEKGASRSTELMPERFGSVGAARRLATADSFAVRFGNLLRDGRLVLAAGWQPGSSLGVFEDVPWGFFALDLRTGEASPLTQALHSDAAFNQHWLQKIAATPDGAHLVIAAHDGKRMSVGQLEQGARLPSRVTSLAAQGSPSALAISADGGLVAVGSEFRGSDAPAKAWVIDRAGRSVWTGVFQKTVAGVYFLTDGSLLVVAGEAKAVKVALPAGTEQWRAE
jgi:hypothetical protein